MNTHNVEPSGVVAPGDEKATYRPDGEFAIANEPPHYHDEESLPSMKEAEVLDVFGNEEGAEIHCT